jgi:hypothetical protein
MAQVSWKSHLEEHGYAIVPDVLNQKECHALHEGYWDFFKTLIGVEKDDASTWKRIYKLFPNHGMLFQHWCSGHMQQIWDVRQNKKIHGAFADIWDTEDLTVSFDGCSFGLQPEVTGRGWQNKGWLHLDQSPHRNDFECVQGWVTALGVEKGDATLTVLAISGALGQPHGARGAVSNTRPQESQKPNCFLRLYDATGKAEWPRA